MEKLDARISRLGHDELVVALCLHPAHTHRTLKLAIVISKRTKCAHMPTVDSAHQLDAIVAIINDHDQITSRIQANAIDTGKLAKAATLTTKCSHENAIVCVEHLNSVIVVVGNK